ncbi:MAG: hypothetical protein R6T98_00715 [Desulfatiglandales bacterium]
MNSEGQRSVFNRGALWAFVVQKREEVNEADNVPEIPTYRGTADRAKFISGGLTHGYVAEKTNPGALELKKSPLSLDQEGLCKGLILNQGAFS